MKMFFSHITRWIVSVLAAILFAIGAASASEDAALVESLNSDREDLQEMDFLGTGQTFDLKDGEVLTLVYLNSCVQEVITGGTVTIGARKSEISGGSIKTVAINCDSDVVTATE